ncbi:DinB family protein [Acaryochloris sp. IP29b_bin.148]|uniref:DinB family protein n=1 Tax=Acaryochloris sp. IP29b_bin.148 TaxID=2969218 RepID=UPI0026159928|nr:DinB family protein [Acaryochloris sp. IP29b_bin.148]
MLAVQAKDMASYNRWMNERLYQVCSELSDTDRKKNTGVFFKSIHGTLNHLLLGDKVWLGRFLGEPFQPQGLDQELHKDFENLRLARVDTDAKIIEWAQTLTDEILSGQLQYTSIVNPATRTYEMWLAVAHFFNHQTHHRGQLTVLLSQFDKEYGVTDLIWLPEVVERNANG